MLKQNERSLITNYYSEYSLFMSRKIQICSFVQFGVVLLYTTFYNVCLTFQLVLFGFKVLRIFSFNY